MTAHIEASLSARLDDVEENIRKAAREAGRTPDGITTIIVTKFHPASMVRDLADPGVRDFGESRHQEARDKVAQVSDSALTWHFVGQVQGTKVCQIARSDFLPLAERALSTEGIQLLGVMAVAPRSARVRGAPNNCAKGSRNLRWHVRGLPRSDTRRRDTPAHWYGNHRKSSSGQLISKREVSPLEAENG